MKTFDEQTVANGRSQTINVSKEFLARRIYFRRAKQTEHSAPESLGRTLSRTIRIGVLRGSGDQVVADSADLIEAWQDEQHAIVREAAAALAAASGLVVEQAFKDASESALRRRVHIYGKRTLFFEDCEALVQAIWRYAEALTLPYQIRERARVAAAKLVELRADGVRKRDPRVARAQRAVLRGTLSSSKTARDAQARRVREAREAMIEARRHVERELYVASIGDAQTCPPHPYTAQDGQERSSDSNRVQLRPRSGFGH